MAQSFQEPVPAILFITLSVNMCTNQFVPDCTQSYEGYATSILAPTTLKLGQVHQNWYESATLRIGYHQLLAYMQFRLHKSQY